MTESINFESSYPSEDEILASLSELPSFSIDSSNFQFAKLSYEEIDDYSHSRDLFADVLDFETISNQINTLDAVSPANIAQPPGLQFQWFQGRILIQIIVRLVIGSIIFGRSIDPFYAGINILLGLLSYLVEIGAVRHLIQLIENAVNEPAALPRQPPIAPGINPPGGTEAVAADGGAGEAIPDTTAAPPGPPAPRVSWSIALVRGIIRSLRAGVGLPRTNGLVFDVLSFVIAFFCSLIPEWNPYGAL